MIHENAHELKARLDRAAPSEEEQIKRELHMVASMLESTGKEFIAQSRDLLR